MAETPVAGQRKRTGLRRGQRVSAPNTDLGSLGLGARTSVQARPVSLLVPNIEPQESPLADVAKKLGFASEQLAQMQKANAKRYQSEAELLAQKVLDSERAKGLSFREIQAKFQSGQYPELRSQLQLDTFNAVYGETAANNYFNNPNGEGYKANEEWNKKFLEAPYEERINMNYEQFLAEQHNNFRNVYGNTNVRLLAGGSKGIAIWKEKRRKEFAENYERRLDEDRIQAVTSSIRNDLMASGVDELDPQGVSSETKVNNSPFLVEASLQNMAQRLDLTGPEKKRAKLAIVENLITDATLQKDPQDQKNNLLIAEKILTTKIPGPVQSLVRDESTFSKVGGGAADRTSTRVKDRALQLLAKINEDLGNIGKDQKIEQISEAYYRAMKSGESSPLFDIQQDNNIGGSGKSATYFIETAVDRYRTELKSVRDHKGQPLSKVESNLRLMKFTESVSNNYLSSGLNQFKNVANASNDLFAKMEVNPDSIQEKDLRQFMDAFALYKAFGMYSPDRLNRIFPEGKSARNLMEVFDAERRYGTSIGQGGEPRATIQQQILNSKDDEFQPQGLKEALINSASIVRRQKEQIIKIDNKELAKIVKGLNDDIFTNYTFFGISDDTNVPEGLKSFINYDLQKFVRHKMKLGIADEETIRDRAHEYLRNTLRGVDVTGTEAVFFTPPNSPFRSDMASASKYVEDRIVAFAKKAGMEDQLDELTFKPFFGVGHDTDKYIIVDAQSLRPIVLDNPNAPISSSIFQVNQENVRNFMKNYTIGEAGKK